MGISYLRFVGLVILFVFGQMSHSSPAKPSPQVKHQIEWKGQFGFDKQTPNTMYLLMCSGYLRAPTSDDFERLVSGWLSKHPRASIVPVFESGPIYTNQPKSEAEYVWVIDGQQNLNEYLVRSGACPGGTMLIPDISNRPPEARNSGHNKMLVSASEYKAFTNRIWAAEAKAQKDKLRIWKNGTDIE